MFHKVSRAGEQKQRNLLLFKSRLSVRARIGERGDGTKQEVGDFGCFAHKELSLENKSDRSNK